jgi:cyclopropane fatty-acyl-phospholipid synthase-like methyltransferase
MGNINDSYFDGYYKDIWRAIIPPDLTRKEVEFMIQHFDLKAGSKVLDIMCGYGRHAIALAEKGVSVTAIDNLGYYIDEIKQAAADRSLPLTAIKADISTYAGNDVFDLAICMGNSLNFFPEKETKDILKSISFCLKPGGYLLINSWSLAETAIGEFKERSWSKVGDFKFIAESKYLFDPTRIETEHLIISPDGKTETKTAVDYIFSVAELKRMLGEMDFACKEIYSIPGKKKFTVGEPRAYIIAVKK